MTAGQQEPRLHPPNLLDRCRVAAGCGWSVTETAPRRGPTATTLDRVRGPRDVHAWQSVVLPARDAGGAQTSDPPEDGTSPRTGVAAPPRGRRTALSTLDGDGRRPLHETVQAARTRIEVRHVPMSTPIPGRPTIVLVHGLGVSAFYFETLIEAFAEHAPVAVFDLPGAGRSEELAGPLSIERLADVLQQVLERSQVTDAVLVGHSMGAQVVVEALARSPHLARAGVLLGPVVAPGQRPWWRLVLQFLRTVRHESFSALWRAGVGYLQMTPLWFLRQFLAMLAYRTEERIRDVPNDLMLMRSQHDFVAPMEFLAELQRNAPGDRVYRREVPDAAHHMMSTHAEVIVAAVLQIAGIHDPLAEAKAAQRLRPVPSDPEPPDPAAPDPQTEPAAAEPGGATTAPEPPIPAPPWPTADEPPDPS